MARATARDNTVFWAFLSPTFGAFLLIVIVPFLLGLWYSFTTWTGVPGEAIQFVGLKNFQTIFHDTRFFYSFSVTAFYALIAMAVINLVAFGLALLVTQELRLKNIYRAGFFLPNLIGGLVLGYVWQFIFNAGLPAAGDVFQIDWLRKSLLASPAPALFALIFVSTWQYAGYIMMIYIAALQNVPRALNEAAAIDGANAWQRLRFITVPMIAPAFTVASFLTMVNSFKMFDVNVSLSGGQPITEFVGKPVFSTELLALNIYNTAFAINNMAAGQAKAILFFLVLAAVALVQVYANKQREVEM